MDALTRQQRPFPAVAVVAVLFVLCIFPGQFWITRLFPGMPGLIKIRPSLVILDIPVQLPVSIDLVLVSGLFLLSYPVVILLYPSRPGLPPWRQAIQRVRSVFAGLFILLFCILSGGLIYYLVQDYLPRQIKTGIGSFGINADIYLPYPGYETIHLRGSTLLFVCFVIGMAICIRKIRKEPGMQKAGQLTREQRMTPYQRMMQEKRSGPAPAASKPAVNQKRSKPEQRVPRLNHNDLHGLCCRQPVTTFRPEAVSYMPMS